MGLLTCKLFLKQSVSNELESCAVRDAGHITPGSWAATSGEFRSPSTDSTCLPDSRRQIWKQNRKRGQWRFQGETQTPHRFGSLGESIADNIVSVRTIKTPQQAKMKLTGTCPSHLSGFIALIFVPAPP